MAGKLPVMKSKVESQKIFSQTQNPKPVEQE